MNDYKACSKCGNTQPLENFRANKASKDGRQSACKSCQKAFYQANKTYYAEYSKKHRAENPEIYSARDKKYYRQNSETIKERSREWYWKNLDRARENRRKTYDSDREAYIEKTRRWKRANRERANQSDLQSIHRRRARLLSNGAYQISDKDLRRLYALPCTYCGELESIQLDHIVPIARGGSHSIGNLAPACRTCNASKGTKTITEWRKRESPRN
jgi:5-methylcytosine-specific restriction endonuclease McrA